MRFSVLIVAIVACLLGAVSSFAAPSSKPVYVVLWFDTEDYIEPAADDAALRIATDLTAERVRGTFKVVGEKARMLERRHRMDVIRALSLHCIGYHSNFHSMPPPPAVYLRRMGLLEGAAEFQRREEPGVRDIERIFGVTPACYGQPGSSWAPQTDIALRKMGIHVYLDDAPQIGLDDQPMWYGGLLYIFNMGRYLIRPDLDHEDRNPAILRRFDQAVATLSANGGGVISTYFHPTEFVTTEFWDAVNFSNGLPRERSQWVRPHRRTPQDTERCFRILREYVEHAKQNPNVRFATARDLLKLYESPFAPELPRDTIAAHLAKEITFLRTEHGNLSGADMLLQLLGLPNEYVDGPTRRGASTYADATIPRWLFDSARKDVISFIQTNGRLPSEVFLGSQTLSLADFTATLAGETASSGPVRVQRGHLAFEKYVATDPAASFRWPIHPPGFSAPELLELGRLQAWTLKPARLR